MVILRTTRIAMKPILDMMECVVLLKVGNIKNEAPAELLLEQKSLNN